MRRFGAFVLAFGAMLVLSACAGKTTGATNITQVSATLHATARCDRGETCRWYWEYWPLGTPRSGSRKTQVQGPVSGPTGNRQLSTTITGLQPVRPYAWVFCASPNNGAVYACAGPDGTFGSTTADLPPDYEVLALAPFPVSLAERWNGKRWRIRPTPTPTGSTSVLNEVSCTSPKACTAVGYDATRTTIVTLAERWNGASWTTQTTPLPPGAGGGGSFLTGVACTSATACTAVGHYFDIGEVPFAEAWDGTSWTIQPIPNPAVGRYAQLSGISCTSATACTAVGYYVDTAGSYVTLAARWDGTSWTIQATPNPSNASFAQLNGVSCTSTAACTAVGTYSSTQGSGTLAERWDGRSWTIQTTPNPTGGSHGQLNGVSCTSAAACIAAGEYGDNAGFFRTLAERWDGTSWTILPTANPDGATSEPTLLAVSCTSATACTAAGLFGGFAERTLAERWDGTTWTLQPTPSPAGAYESTFNGVSCTSTTRCTAVGSQ